jgi:AcrR family transcriptional regulator
MSSNAAAGAPSDDDGVLDARIERSARALQGAMHDLLHERPFADITVQHIIDRAGVSRGTFYARYRSKDDALFHSVERMFGGFASHLASNPRDTRLVPVAELLGHFADAGAVRSSLVASGRMDEIWTLLADFIADLIVRRLPLVSRAATTASVTAVPPPVTARMLAGALMAMMEWWIDHQAHITAVAMDGEFHRMARRMLDADAARA